VHSLSRFLASFDAFVTTWPGPWGVDFGSGGPRHFQGFVSPPPLWHAIVMPAPPGLEGGGALLQLTLPASVEDRFRGWALLRQLLPSSRVLA
jgi:hypothetical protein